MSDKIPGEVYNALRLQFKKGESMTYLKELCEKYKENIEEFTSTAMKAAYDYNRAKALDYMLNLPGRHEASLLVKIHVQSMIYNQNSFDKGAKIMNVLCKHFQRSFILEEIDKCRNPQDNREKQKNEHNQRFKEVSVMVYNETLVEKNIKHKISKI
jgi:hypothetical protein